MKGDFSRVSFDPRRRATDVLRQQGRVDLDADWNEQRAIDGHLRRTALTDVIGQAAAPLDAAGFGLVAAGADLRLGPGRLYIGGVLCENDVAISVFDQPDLPAGLPVLRRPDGQWAAGPPPAAGVYTVALEVWPQHRSVVEDPTLREVALGGPDTTTRLRTVWQARLLHLGPPAAAVTCTTDPAGWADWMAPSSGTLRAWSNPDSTPPSDCLIPLSAPYRGLDNQLYRVEIMAAGAPGTARYVWSRDNGSVAAVWAGRDGDILTLRSPGRDGSSGFAAGCWVQLTDDTAELRGAFGTLAQVDRVEGDRLVLKAGSANGSLQLADFPRRPRVRRWDGWGITPAGGSDVALEAGVIVAFGIAATQRYRIGDWWSFAARTATRDVEWPRTGSPPVAVPLPPHGPPRRHAKLGIALFDGTNWSVLRDCRDLFAPLADQRVLLYLGGDGQAVKPASTAAPVALPQPLAVAATLGGRPLPNTRVRFAITAGNGRLNGATGPLTLLTDAAGEARCSWSVDSANDRQEVTATLLDDGDAPAAPAIRFGASLLRAAGVAYDPGAAPILSGATDVQSAIDRLATLGGGGCSTLVLSPGPGWVAALQSLRAGQDATVCFRPGVYRADGPVVIRGLGHVRLSGGGEATRIQVEEGEAALRFEDCDSVVVEDLVMAVQSYPRQPESRLNGVLTILDCGSTEVRGSRFACPSDLLSRGTCVTVRGAAEGSQRLKPAVTVEHCAFAVGFAQTGVLLVNAGTAHVAGNRFRAAAPPAWLTPERALAAAPLRGALTKLLVGAVRRVATTTPGHAGFNTVVRVGDYMVRMNSSVPDAEWAEIIRTDPPAATEGGSPDAVRRYVERMAQALVAQPSRSPTLMRSLTGARRRLGLRAQLLDGPEAPAAIRAILGAEDVQVARLEPEADGTGVRLRTGAGVLRIESALPQRAWDLLLREAPLPETDDERRLTRHLRRVSRRILTEPSLAARVAPAFLKAVTDAVRGRGRAIVVGGAFAPVVSIDGNIVVGLTEGVHVGTSVRGDSASTAPAAETVRIRSNEIALARQPDGLLPPRGIFVGNTAARVAIEGNRIISNGALVGIEVFGRTGPHLVVRDNMMEGTRKGVLFRPIQADDKLKLWIIADNIARGGIAVDAPAQARVTGNVP